MCQKHLPDARQVAQKVGYLFRFSCFHDYVYVGSGIDAVASG